ncbi:hypothetical protein M407DRAFT_34318 [Tulasnella calospora MUT 4182]|uniref:Uncharacterized protein n=1 Tax=Tulasnella calospora MUT 4182 TaxID=1051891 RepID=A0A0C3PNP2_9AGAM|nr:hypothetical protein M407DRAFT_34318 [Tulasnella calospora MUT 4182]
MSAEGKLVLYSHSTGPDGSLEWTAQYFPRREYWYYISHYAGLAARAKLRHPPQHRAGSGMELEKDDRAEANITEVANLAEEDGIAGDDDIMPKEKFKYHRRGKRLTARKNRQQKQDEDQGNPEARPSSAN